MQNLFMQRRRPSAPYRAAFVGVIQHAAFYLQRQRVVQ